MEKLEGCVIKAMKLSMEAHANQKDKAGENYFLHPVTVAMTLAKNGYSACNNSKAFWYFSSRCLSQSKISFSREVSILCSKSAILTALAIGLFFAAFT